MVDFRKALKPRLDLNPSSAARWMTCTASPAFIRDNAHRIPPDDTVFSQEGTTAHEVARALLLNEEPVPAAMPVPRNPEMEMHTFWYQDYVESLRKPGSRLLVEQKLPLWYMPGRNCIVDAAVIGLCSLDIIDFKYGEGVAVSPEENPQMVIYLKNIIHHYQNKITTKLRDDFVIRLHIYQPRNRHADEPQKVWETTWGRASKLADEIEATAQGIIAGTQDTEFKPSAKACQFCPARGFCDARLRHLTTDVETLAVIDDTAMHFPPAESISVKQISAVLRHGGDIIKWVKDVHAYALRYMKNGGRLPGFKLVNSRGGHRYWTNPATAAKLLLATLLRREEVIQEKTISPAEAEKLLGKGRLPAALLPLIGKPAGKPTIAAEADERADLLELTDDFDNLDL